MASGLIEADTIYHLHENILDLIPSVINRKFSVTLQAAKSLNSFSVFRHGCYQEKYISFVVMGILKALQHIHLRENLVHGNINLNNVFLDGDCRVKLELPTRKNCVIEEQKADIRMVGELASSLFYGKSVNKVKFGWFWFSQKKRIPLSRVLEDFVKFCANPLRTPTLREVINHELLKKNGEFDRYQEELKKLLQKKLLKI